MKGLHWLNCIGYIGFLLLLICAGCDRTAQTAIHEPKVPTSKPAPASIESKAIPNKLTAEQAVRIAMVAVAKHEHGPGRLVRRTEKPVKEPSTKGEIWWVEIYASHVNRRGRTLPTSTNYGNPARLIGIDGRGKVISYGDSD